MKWIRIRSVFAGQHLTLSLSPTTFSFDSSAHPEILHGNTTLSLSPTVEWGFERFKVSLFA